VRDGNGSVFRMIQQGDQFGLLLIGKFNRVGVLFHRLTVVADNAEWKRKSEVDLVVKQIVSMRCYDMLRSLI